MTPTAESPTPDWQHLSSRLEGELLRPGDDRYEEARTVWNARIDRRPGAIARCGGPSDVEAALDFARDRDLPVAVRGGGHDYAGRSVCDDGLVVDVSSMTTVEVDAGARTVRAGPGATWGDVDRKTQELGLATTGATVSTVGVAGYTLGGGSGHLARSVGLGADNLVAADVVTPDGGFVRANEMQNADLFWALRGGGGNFGVVVGFEYALHDVGPEVLSGQIIYPFRDAASVLRAYAGFMAEAPDELVCYAFVFPLPPDPAFPEEHHGKPVLDLVVVHVGDPAEGEELIGPLRALGDPILDAVQRESYVSVQKTFDAGMPSGLRWYSKAHYLRTLPDEAIETVVDRCAELPGTHTMAYLEPLGGAVGRADTDATAFPHRDAPFSFHILPGWADPGDDERIVRWARSFHDAMEPHATGGVYLNLLAEDEGERVPAAYGANYERLRTLKGEWDARNVLRANHNIPPGGEGA